MNGGAGRSAEARARELVAIFHADQAAFGSVVAVPGERVAAGPRRLLDHGSHMTVAMEKFHGGPVTLRVADRREDAAGRYSREILLVGPDGRIVQHGIVRIDLGRLPPVSAAAIRAEREPLGRILLAAGLLCPVHDVCLLRITPGPHLESMFGGGPGGETFGRVAEIGVAGAPAIELLEIVAPGTAD